MSNSCPITVRYCRFCGGCAQKDATGFSSIEMDEWFCNVTCYYQTRLSRGDIKINTHVSNVLIKMREKNGVYDPQIIKKRKERAEEGVKNGRLKFIRRTHAREDIPIQD